MAKKIAKIDADAMNSLYAAEMEKAGGKTAAVLDDNGQDKGITAFADHDEYLKTLESALKSDKNVEGADANDKVLD